VRRDTIAVNANSYAVVRYQASNPGVWLFHCHIEWQGVMGLMATIIEVPEKLRGLLIPTDLKAAFDVQDIPTAGNVADNTQNLTDMTGENTFPQNLNNGEMLRRLYLARADSSVRRSA
jgi:iron transport multicopper oxidase